MRAMRGKTSETVPFQPYFGCTKSFLKVLSSEYCQATRAMRAKRVVTVPLNRTLGSTEELRSVGSPQMWVWPQLVFGRAPPIPHCNWRTLPSSQSPFLPALSLLLPPTRLGSFCNAPGVRDGAAQSGVGGGVLWWGGGGGPSSGTWGQTHIWGHSTLGDYGPKGFSD